MKTPKISIVMAVYNTEKYLQECIDSILSQTFSDFELIIVDDGSTDNSRDIIKSYKDSRIKLFENTHDYIGSLNIGMSIAQGQYIARMDSDDIMKENRLEIQYLYMEENPDVDLNFSWVKSFGRVNSLIDPPTEHNDIVTSMLFYNPILHNSVFIRRSSLFRINKFPVKYNRKYIYAEDYKLWTDLAREGFKFASIPEVLVLYRASETQVTYKNENQVINRAGIIKYEYLEYVANMLAQKDPSLFQYLKDTIALFNRGEMNLASLRQIIYYLYTNQMTNISLQ